MLDPQTEVELSEAIASATGPLSIQGGGTRGLPVLGTPLTTSRIAGISLYEPGALTLVAKAGTKISDIEAALAAENQMLAFEPMDFRALLGTSGTPTIGGVVATNCSGPRRVQSGACRDLLLGVRFVDGLGTIIKNGGRVMKNVTGYDLARLMCGAHGTLGVLTEVSLKVLPKPEAEATLTLGGLSVGPAVKLMSDALGSPYAVSGASLAGDAVHLRVEGLADSVTYRAGKLTELFGARGEGAHVRQGEDSARLWAGIRDATAFATPGDDIWRISVKPTEAPVLCDRLPKNAEALIDWGGGLMWLRMPEGTDLRAALGGFDGHATLVRASDETKARLGVFHPEVEPLATMAKALRTKFDPKGLLNPGLMGAP